MFKIRVEENIQKKKHSEIEGVKVVYRIFVFQLKKDFALIGEATRSLKMTEFRLTRQSINQLIQK